jgi:hypothetical protein
VSVTGWRGVVRADGLRACVEQTVVHGLSFGWIEILEGLDLLLVGPGMVCLAGLAPGCCRIVLHRQVLLGNPSVHGSNFGEKLKKDEGGKGTGFTAAWAEPLASAKQRRKPKNLPTLRTCFAPEGRRDVVTGEADPPSGGLRATRGRCPFVPPPRRGGGSFAAADIRRPERAVHGFRDAYNGVAPPVATIHRPLGAKVGYVAPRATTRDVLPTHRVAPYGQAANVAATAPGRTGLGPSPISQESKPCHSTLSR